MVSIRKRKYFLAAAANGERFKVLVRTPSGSVEQPYGSGLFRTNSSEVELGARNSGNQKLPFQDKELKKRKLHRRKQVNNQEPCMLRGVYFKNLKWQAAIKVGKKQVHLGTVSTQEEAAHLYDRAAYMCGREPNFALSDEEKQELQSFEWDEFLAVTRKAIAHKKMKNKVDAQVRRRQGPVVPSSL